MQLSSYLLSAQEVIRQYNGEVPFAAWLKDFFRQHKKYGSRDRKAIADLCFCYFRLGKAFDKEPLEERMLRAQFLCHEHSPFVQEFRKEWLENAGLLQKEKLRFLDASQQPAIFPFPGETSAEIDLDAFQLSFLQQPDLFLRIRPGKEKKVLQKLQHAGVAFLHEGDCLRLPNTTKVDDILLIDTEAVIQDINSQRVLEPLQTFITERFQQTPAIEPGTPNTQNPKHPKTLWDCCAASGGKTILFHDRFPQAKLTASDIRESIIINLRNRLKRAGISSYNAFVADVASPHFSLQQKFDVILCDAPCSGSGTWARTPEQLSFFTKERIDHYASLQRNIATNAARYLRENGVFLYITCSVFRRENEEVVDHLQANTGLKVHSQTYFNGYGEKGDTLFAALFTAS